MKDPSPMMDQNKLGNEWSSKAILTFFLLSSLCSTSKYIFKQWMRVLGFGIVSWKLFIKLTIFWKWIELINVLFIWASMLAMQMRSYNSLPLKRPLI